MVLSGGSSIDDVCTAASVCIGRRRNATEHDGSGETKQKGDELQREDGGR